MSRKNLEYSISSFDSNLSTSNESPILASNNSLLKNDKLNYFFLLKENKSDPKYKTELCKKYMQMGSCPYGSKCRFAHGKEELLEKKIDYKTYKQTKCKSFYSKMYCNYGSRCNFKHDERSLEKIKKNYFSNLLKYLSLALSNEKILESHAIQSVYVNNIPSSILKKNSRFY